MSNENNRGKNKEKKKKVSILRVILLAFLIFSIILSASVMGMVFGVVKNAKPIDPNNLESMLDESSFIYDQDGNLVDKIHGGSFKTTVELDKVPKDLQNAFVAIEDERFYKHNGIDFIRLFGALWYDIKTLSKAQGASTITLQLSKNMYTSSEKTITRKIKDAYYAIQLEKHLSKEEILKAYLNTAGLGRGATGVQAAAQTYFSKDVSELNLAESAMIAGITKYPYKYSPYVTQRFDGSENLSDFKDKLVFYPKTSGMEPASDVEKEVFKKLYSKGYIKPYQYEDLMKEQKVVRKAVDNPDSKARQEIVLGKMLELGYINDEEYNEAKNAPIEIKVPKEKANDISSYFADLIKDEVIDSLIQKGYSEDEARDILYNGGLRIYSTIDMDMQKILETEYQNNSNFPGSFRDKKGVIQPQSAMVIMDYHTGQIKSLIGGRMAGGGSMLFNRATSPRQPGSSIKPLAVYVPALDNGMSAATSIADEPFSVGKWQPKNYGGRYRGDITLRESVQYSSNIGAVKTAQMLGMSESSSIDIMMDYLENMGITTLVKTPGHNDKNYPALTLGGMTKGITPLQLTAAYGSIANEGTYIKPILFTKIETPDGKVLVENKVVKHKVVNPQVAYIMTDILKSVVTSGTGGGARISNMPVAGKTGTTSDNKDAWFAGYTPYYVAATWIGNDMNESLPKGSAMAAHLWSRVMSKVHSKLEHKNFERPDGLIEKTICNDSGDVATHFCPSTRTEIFIKGSEPKGYCKLHTRSYEEDIEETEETEETEDSTTEMINKWLGEDSQNSNNQNQDNPGNQNNTNKSGKSDKSNKPDKSNTDQNGQNTNNQNLNNQNQGNQNIQIIDSN